MVEVSDCKDDFNGYSDPEVGHFFWQALFVDVFFIGEPLHFFVHSGSVDYLAVMESTELALIIGSF